MSLNKEISATKGNELERNIQNFALPTPRFARKFSSLESSLSCRRSLSAELHGGTTEEHRSRKCISINSLILRHFSVGKRPSRPRYVPVLTFTRKLCCGSKKCIWATQYRKTSQSIGRHRFPNFEMVDAKIASALKNIIMNTTSRRESVWRSKRPNTFG